jgi:hypothetical protein
MLKHTFLDLCKKVSTAWPKSNDPVTSEKLIIEHVSILRSLSKYINSSIQMEKKKRKAQSLGKETVDGEAAHVHRCSLDSRHYHLMIHGEALARRMMKQKKVFASNPQAQIVANHHLKRLDYIHATLRRRSIIQVTFDEPPIDYMNALPQASVDRHFLITRVTNYR